MNHDDKLALVENDLKLLLKLQRDLMNTVSWLQLEIHAIKEILNGDGK